MAIPEPRRRRLQICATGLLAQRPDLLRQLQSHGCTIETESCLDQCTRCVNTAIALVDGQFLISRSPVEFCQQLLGKDSISPSGKR